VNDSMKKLGSHRSAIRELFEYGKRRKAEIGAENVFDFSIGNPSVPAPDAVQKELIRLLETTDPVALHGYTSAQGDPGVRASIADYLNRTYQAEVDANLIYLTAGAAAALTCSLTALLNPGDEVVLPAPFFPEYRVFVERTGAKVVPVACDPETFQPDYSALEAAIGEKTRVLLINSPNNPTGAVIPESGIQKIAAILSAKEKEFGNPIYLISDEPYRELVWGNEAVPYLTRYYNNTLVCYSFSKSLSLPGERIGYVLISPKAEDANDVYAAVCGAGRALGFVCAPALFQFLVPKCLGLTADFSIYKKNRELLTTGLRACGFTVVEPDGAFYLFVKSPEPDANAFAERAKGMELLLVPSDSFGCPGYVRVSYCVSTAQIEKSLPAFRKLAESYGLK